jgi:hypothetical protein
LDSDILEQDIGGRGNVSNLGESTVADNLDIAQYFLDNVNLAKNTLRIYLEWKVMIPLKMIPLKMIPLKMIPLKMIPLKMIREKK